MTTRMAVSLLIDPSSQAWDLCPNPGPSAGRALDAELAAERMDAVGKTAQPRPERGVCSADAVVANLDTCVPVQALQVDRDRTRVCVLRDVGQRLCGDVVGGGLDRGRQAPAQPARD